MSYTNYDFPHTHFYESDLREILSMLNKLQADYTKLVTSIDDLNEWKKTHTNEYKELVKRLEAIQNEIDTFESEINASFDELKREQQEEFNELIAQVNNYLAEVRTEINNEIARLRKEVNDAIIEINSLLQSNNEFMMLYIENRLQRFIDDLPEILTVMVYNPYRGAVTDIQTAINDIYSVAAIWGLTAAQYDSLQLTASEYDNLEVTAQEYDTLGYKLLYKDPNYHMYSPFTGDYVTLQDVIMDLAHLHMGGVTAEHYDNLELTAEEYDNKELTAFQYDWYADELLTA
jgi:hypothetical protein